MKQLIKESQRARSQASDQQKGLLHQHLGEFLFKDNEEFRQKTQTCYIVKKGFTLESIDK